MAASLRDRLRIAPGEPVDLAALDPRATPLAPGGKSATKTAMEQQGAPLAALQEALYAQATTGAPARVLVVLQGMDTSGKGGVIEHVIGLVNPQGVQITLVQEADAGRAAAPLPVADPPGGAPTRDDRHLRPVALRGRADRPGAPAGPGGRLIERRYADISRFERQLVADGVAVVKCFLHISYDEQRERLLARLDDPAKHWKFNEGDLAERARWTDYQEAYRTALERCSSPEAPWYVVPADRKWYRNWAVGTLLLETLRELDPRYPTPELDVRALKKRLAPPN